MNCFKKLKPIFKNCWPQVYLAFNNLQLLAYYMLNLEGT